MIPVEMHMADGKGNGGRKNHKIDVIKYVAALKKWRSMAYELLGNINDCTFF